MPSVGGSWELNKADDDVVDDDGGVVAVSIESNYGIMLINEYFRSS